MQKKRIFDDFSALEFHFRLDRIPTLVYNKEESLIFSFRKDIDMLELSKKSNLLEQSTYQYHLQDIDEPNLYREIYNYDEIPKIPFNHRRVPLRMPDEIWITDKIGRAHV